MNQYSVGLVGCGLISEAHLKAWATTPGFAVKGVLDTNRDQATKRASQFGIGTIYDRLDQLIGECDVVDVCTPPSSHASIAEQAIAGGRHIVMEKPVVTDVSDWDRIAPRAREAGTKLAVIHNAKFLDSVQLAKRWVDEGRIGDVLRVHREFLTDPSTDRMLTGQKHWSHGLPGGRWFETMPHDVYLTHWLAGPLALSSVNVVCSPNAPPGAPADEVLVVLKGDRVISTFQFSASCKENRRTLTIQGTTGRIVVDMLSDFASISNLSDSKLRRAAGRAVMEAGSVLVRAAYDRGRYAAQRLRKQSSPHRKIIHLLGRHLHGQAEEPTPFDEVDYVIRNCDAIGREIDRQVAAIRGRT
jgi:predicted dehydrogenase